MNLSRSGFGALCICAVRYCLRKDHCLSDVVREICVDHVAEISRRDLEIMISDVEAWLRSENATVSIYEEEWRKWKSDLIAEKENRKRDHCRNVKIAIK